MTAPNPESLYCVNHPQTATLLRCNKCGRPVCARCIVRTPVGYRCKDCNRSQQQVYVTAQWPDYVIAFALPALLAPLCGLLSVPLGFFVIFLAPVAGGGIAELVRLAVRRRRGRQLHWTAAGGFVAGCLPLLGYFLFLALGGGLASLTGLLWPALYIVLGAGALLARLRGISIG
jgi:hypothetical protein